MNFIPWIHHKKCLNIKIYGLISSGKQQKINLDFKTVWEIAFKVPVEKKVIKFFLFRLIFKKKFKQYF